MDNILISFNVDVIPEFSLRINGKEVSYTVADHQIDISHDVIFGVNLLEIEAVNLRPEQTIVITDFQLNGVSSRQTLYLAYSGPESSKQGNTWLTSQVPIITIPFGNPMSWWMSECGKKIPNTLYSANPYSKFDIYYPTSLEVDASFPQLMRDFMKYDFGFQVVDKSLPKLHNKEIPWLKSNIQYNEEKLFKEIYSNIKILESNYYNPRQNQYNEKEKTAELWQVAITTHDFNVEEISQTDFPEFFSLLEQVKAQGVKILHSFIGTVRPGSYVAPHVDALYNEHPDYKNAIGCSQIYIPIGWKPGNYLKFANIGFVPHEQGAFVVNNAAFMHGSVNMSDQLRFTIGIYCEFTEESLKNIT